MRLRTTALLLTGLTLAGVAGHGRAQIKAYTLPEMAREADGYVYGEIVARNVFRVDDEEQDGPQLYFTTLTLQGMDLVDGTSMTVDVTFNGGFIAPGDGVWNSEAPTGDDTRIGRRVVVFYKWSDNMGGRVAGNSLLASHGGLYRTVMSGSEPVVLGRGKGYAVDANVAMSDLSGAIKSSLKVRKR